MLKRVDLQARLEELLGTPNVYFQPPESMRIQYDAIVYFRKDIQNSHANDSVYKQDAAYEVVAIYKNPDSDLPMKISRLPMCSFDRHYVADNLNHDVFTLYW
jgi:hypothetical protein